MTMPFHAAKLTSQFNSFCCNIHATIARNIAAYRLLYLFRTAIVHPCITAMETTIHNRTLPSNTSISA